MLCPTCSATYCGECHVLYTGPLGIMWVGNGAHMPWCCSFEPPVPPRGQGPLHREEQCFEAARERVRVLRAEMEVGGWGKDGEGEIKYVEELVPVQWASRQTRREVEKTRRKDRRKWERERMERREWGRLRREWEKIRREREKSDRGDRVGPWNPRGLFTTLLRSSSSGDCYSRRYGCVLGPWEMLMERFLRWFVWSTGAGMWVVEGWRWRKELLVLTGLSQLLVLE